MLDFWVIVAVFSLYVFVLIGIAWWAEKSPRGRRWADGPVAYSLALGVYCSSWTFYGSVGSAASSGPLFVAVYLGPTLVMFCAGTFLRRMLAFAREHRTGNIADFVAAAYGGSQTLGVLVTLMTLAAITPYIALQIKSVIATFSLLVGERYQGTPFHYADELMIVLLVVLTIVLGLRTLDTTERHRGVTLVLAAQSLLKLASFLVCGWFVTYSLFDGGQDLLQRYAQAQVTGLVPTPTTGTGTWYMQFMTWMVLAMGAIFLLPRMFQVLVVENVDPDHLRTASWLFPLFLLLINLFVLPMAAAGLVHGWSRQEADTFVLRLPLEAHADGLALLVFLGGFSAAMGMIVVATMAMSAMVSNYLLLPLADAARPFAFIRRYLLQARWLVAALTVFLAYTFQQQVGVSQFLIDMGLVSFAGFAQLLPAVVGGLVWRGARRAGAIAGISAGFAAWAYTLFLPLVARSGWLPLDLALDAPFGIGWLRSEHMFGMYVLPPLLHGVFWSLLMNFAAYTLVSAFAAAHVAEAAAARFELPEGEGSDALELAPVRRALESCLQKFLPPAAVASLLAEAERGAGIEGADATRAIGVARYLAGTEAGLAASIGSAAARGVFARAEILAPAERQRVQQAYGEMVAELNISPEELRRRIDFSEERKAIAETHAGELAVQLATLQREVDARTQAERAMRESEQRFRLLADNAPVMIWMADARGKREYFNRMWMDYVGMDSPNAVSREWFEQVHEADRAGLLKLYDDALAGQGPNVFEYRLRRSDGFYRWLREHAVARVSADGTVLGYIGSAFDVTDVRDAQTAMRQINLGLESTVAERTRDLSSANAQLKSLVDRLQTANQQLAAAQDELSRKEEELRLILENMHDGVITIDGEGTIRGVNPAVTKIFGYPDKAMLGEKLLMLMPEESHAPHRAGMLLYAETGESNVLGRTVEFDGLRPDGSRVPIDLSVNVYTVRGERFYTGIIRDITARKQAEAALRAHVERLTETNRKLEEAQNQLLQSEKMASIGQLAAGVAHEINNPVGYVQSNLCSLANYVDELFRLVVVLETTIGDLPVDDPRRLRAEEEIRAAELEFLRQDVPELIAETKEGVGRVRKIVQDLRDFSHPDTGQVSLSDLHGGLLSTLNIVHNELKYKAEVVTDFGDLPPVECNLSQLNQVFLNLLVNGAHAIAERGQVTVMTRHDAVAGEVTVAISDTGCGIPAENLQRVFDPFFTTKPVGKGTGLGLSLSYGIVQRHHGRIEIDSEVGKGTTFRVILPVRQPAVALPAGSAVPLP
jgi:PAS domain S-box-containing protein